MQDARRQHPYTIFQVIELKLSQTCDGREVEPDKIPESYDEFTQFVLCVRNLNKPTLKQIDQQRVDLVYWLSEYFGRYIPTEFLLPIVDIDMAASSLNIFLPRVDIKAVNASLEDVYNFLRKIAPFIEVPDEVVDNWRRQQKEKRLHQQRYSGI